MGGIIPVVSRDIFSLLVYALVQAVSPTGCYTHTDTHTHTRTPTHTAAQRHTHTHSAREFSFVYMFFSLSGNCGKQNNCCYSKDHLHGQDRDKDNKKRDI